MPRQGDGSGDNAIETGNNIIHGAGEEPSTRVARADKTAPMPEHEEGQAVKGLNASGGSSQGLAKGPEAGQGGGSIHGPKKI